MRSTVEDSGRGSQPTAGPTPRKGVIVGVLVVTLMSVGWIVYSLTRSAPAPPVGDVPAAVRYLDSIAPKLAQHERELAQVVFSPTPDNAGVVVTGSVGKQADLELLKRIIDAGQPRVPVEVKVTRGP
jgi:hypothetical protein